MRGTNWNPSYMIWKGWKHDGASGDQCVFTGGTV